MTLPMQAQDRKAFSRFVSAPFTTAVILLGIAAVLSGPVTTRMKLIQRKRSLPLRAPLASLSVEALAPYQVIQRQQLEPAMVEALGTDQYIYWMLEDAGLPVDDPLRVATLFVTYYTGGANLVPHVPDVCFLGSGYRPDRAHENKEVKISALGPGRSEVPIRVLTFVKTAVHRRSEHSVLYNFYCNGAFVATRNGVRLRVNNLTNTYGYFSKVEVSFPNASREQSVKGVVKLFNKVLPVLREKHWPDFEAAEARVRAKARANMTDLRDLSG